MLAPRLAANGSYTILNGATTNDQALTSPMNILGSAQLGLRAALSADLGDRGRVNTLSLGPVISQARPHGPAGGLRDTDIGQLAVAIATSQLSGADMTVHSRDGLTSVFESLC